MSEKSRNIGLAEYCLCNNFYFVLVGPEYCPFGFSYLFCVVFVLLVEASKPKLIYFSSSLCLFSHLVCIVVVDLFSLLLFFSSLILHPWCSSILIVIKKKNIKRTVPL